MAYPHTRAGNGATGPGCDLQAATQATRERIGLTERALASAAVVPVVLAVVHLTVAAAWAGSMAYSLVVVQPKVAAFFAADARQEEFLTVLAQGNRWRVIGLVAVLLVSGIGVVVTTPTAAVVGFAVAVGLDAVAALAFVEVSWRHWPRRVFALPEEVPGYQRALRVRARAMLVLVGIAFVIALGSAVGLGVR
jgi:hypothetical protein